ncbi:hypothetical protein, partial [Herpetosiphon geysericola]
MDDNEQYIKNINILPSLIDKNLDIVEDIENNDLFISKFMDTYQNSSIDNEQYIKNINILPSLIDKNLDIVEDIENNDLFISKF